MKVNLDGITWLQKFEDTVHVTVGLDLNNEKEF
jgi:hypothetical protein